MIRKFLMILFLVSVVSAQEKPVIAILKFTNPSGKVYLEGICKSFPTILKTELSQERHVVVVERENMEAILKEQDFVLSDLSEDKDKSAKVGNLLGADYLITGSVVESEDRIRIDVTILRTSTGQVISEKVTGPSKEKLSPMGKILANNIVYDLTGNGDRQKKIKLRGAPTATFALTTLGLGIAGGISFSAMKKARDDYRSTTDLDKINSEYNRANKLNKSAQFFTAMAAGALCGTIYCWFKNRTTDLEVLADHNTPSIQYLTIAPIHGTSGATLSLNFSF